MKTYEEILQGMLEKVPGEVDKREGSVIYDALAPCAYYLAQQTFLLENFVDLVFADTAAGEYLDRIAAMFGLTRKPATYAVRKLLTSAAVTAGTRWTIKDVTYSIKKQLAELEYEAQCELAGDIGNQYSGSLQPVSQVSGVTAELADIIIAGADKETDSALRRRFYDKARQPATSGNAFHYMQWASEVPGVGAAKVFPLADGPGTVLVLIVNSDKEISPALEPLVSAYIEQKRPVGATVTVSSPAGKPIDISAEIILDGSRTKAEVFADFSTAVRQCLKEMVFTEYRISHGKIGSILLAVAGVSDYSNLLLNGTTGNIMIAEKEVPAAGTISLQELIFQGWKAHDTNNELIVKAPAVSFKNIDQTGYIPLYAKSFNTSSSTRYKESIRKISEDEANNLLKLVPYKFDYIYGDKEQYGFLAEELAEIQEQGLMRNEKGCPEAIDYSKLIPQILKLVQLQEQRIRKLEISKRRI